MEAKTAILEDTNAKQVLHLLDIIDKTNTQISHCKTSEDNFGTRQYEYLKSKYVKELIELLSKYELTVQIKEAEIKEAA